MSLLNKTFTLALTLSICLAGTILSSCSNQSASSAVSSVAEDTEVLAQELGKLFKDPGTGAIKKQSYKAYLTIKSERLEIVKKFIDAQTQSERFLLNSKLQRIDKKILLLYSAVKRRVLTLSQKANIHFQKPETLEKVKLHDPKRFGEWEKAREILVNKIKSSENRQHVQVLSQEMSALDQEFRLSLLGFLIGLTPSDPDTDI